MKLLWKSWSWFAMIIDFYWVCKGTCLLSDHFLYATPVLGTSYTLVSKVSLAITPWENYAKGHFTDKDIETQGG